MLNKAFINLSTLKENALNIKSKLDKEVFFNAVVKADAYGHGAEMIANALYTIVDGFSVALVEEGIALRQSGIDKEILVLNEPFDCDLVRGIEYGLTFSVQSVITANKIAQLSEHMNKTTSVHISVNTGMNREGVDGEFALHNLIQCILNKKSLKLKGVYSHLKDASEKYAVKSQVDKFLLAIKCLNGYNINIRYHISASGGFLVGLNFNMVRIGLLLYGYKPFDSNYISVKPIMNFVCPTVGERKLYKGQSVLYGVNKLESDKNATLLRLGYADGFFRKKGLDLLNNRCMDISAISGKNLFADFNADIMAKEYGTISYEILTNVTKRAEKIYYD